MMSTECFGSCNARAEATQVLLTQAEHQDYFNKCQLGGSQEPGPLAFKGHHHLTQELTHMLVHI